ncbi:hydrogenase maturation protease [Actinomadura hallensis]|uniref:Hydrogenase maturation protease n=1 Tax=Actinomadura hallensis TaxID=337895 RepID=A0A543IB31_9ACTN|nr:hydrogenase maturation protease [Actinomadura hallensis]TQM67741.1 hydrogenase maturation protease [Actinomadura hallensis]
MSRVLVAGIGNVFLADDGFGVEVARRMARSGPPEGVRVADYGIRGVHLAYELLDGRTDTLIMVDAVPVEGPPGTLAVIEVDGAAVDEAMAGLDPSDPLGPPAVDGHGMNPVAVLRTLRRLGGEIGRVLVVGCRPAVIEERMELSEPVRAVLDDAVRLVTDLARDEANREEADREDAKCEDAGRDGPGRDETGAGGANTSRERTHA